MDVRISCLLVVAAFVCSGYCSRSTVKLNNVPFKQCDGGKQAKLVKISTDAAVNGMVELIKGTNVTMYFEFQMMTTQKTAISEVYGKLGFLPKVPFPLPNADACSKCNITCPLDKGQTYTYVIAIEVKTLYPSARLEVFWELTANGKADPKTDIWCAVIPAEIKDK